MQPGQVETPAGEQQRDRRDGVVHLHGPMVTRGGGAEKKQIVFALMSREGEARTFHVQNVKGTTLKGIIRENVEGGASIYTPRPGR